MHGLCMGHTGHTWVIQVIHGSCMCHVWVNHGSYMGHVLYHLYGSYKGDTGHNASKRSYMGHVRVMCGSAIGHIWVNHGSWSYKMDPGDFGPWR